MGKSIYAGIHSGFFVGSSDYMLK